MTGCDLTAGIDSDLDTAECRWATSWVIGVSDQLDPGEQVDMTVTLSLITGKLLTTKKEFTIQVKPNVGAVVIVNKTTPPELKTINVIE